MARLRYLHPRYGRFPWWLTLVLGGVWASLLAVSHLNSDANYTAGAEDVFLRYVDREMRFLVAGKEQGGLLRWLVGADDPGERMEELLETMELGAAHNELSDEGTECLAYLYAATGDEQKARALLENGAWQTLSGHVLWVVLFPEEGEADPTVLADLRSAVETGDAPPWQAATLEQAEAEGLVAEVDWKTQYAFNDEAFARGQRALLVLGVTVLIGLVCLPFAVRRVVATRPPPVPRVTGRWTTVYVLGLFFAAELVNRASMGLQNIGSAGLMELLRSGPELTDRLGLMFYYLWFGQTLAWQALPAVLLVAVMFVRPRHAFAVFGGGRPVPWTLVWAMFPVLLGFNWLLGFVFSERVEDPTDFFYFVDPAAREILLDLASAALAAAFFEEIVYRGVLFFGLRKALGGWGAFALSTVAFALVHVQYDPAGLISVGFFGACCCFLAWRTGSLLPGMILHGMYNFFITGEVYLLYQAPLRIP